MNPILKWALFYQDKLGWSIIPINPKSKRPIVKWKHFIKYAAQPEQLEAWWGENPNANIGVVTGSISNLTVIDIDEYEVPGTLAYMKELYADATEDPTPPWEHTVTARTPSGGYHWFFQHRDDMVSRRVIPAVDCKTEGGYVVISPSRLNGRRYSWERPPFNKTGIVVPSVFPAVYESLFSVKKNSSCMEEEDCTPSRVVDFGKGSRDESLFHVANSLVKGNCNMENVKTVLYALGDACVPPFPKREIDAKIISALGRGVDRLGSLAEEIREWVNGANGVWTYELLDRDLKVFTKQERANRRVVIHRLCEEGIVEPAGGRAGTYRRVLADAETIDFINVVESDIYDSFEFPLGEENLFRLMPKNIIIVSGSPDSGKTAYMMNLVYKNQHKFPIQYNSSEMGALEFRARLKQFPNIMLDEWNFVAKERGGDFHDIIQPDGINIVDFLEMHDNFYEVGKHIKRIFDRLRDGVAFIALQKNPGTENPLGGHRAREKARLVINLDHDYPGHKAKITKAKNWRTHENPRGLSKYFSIIDGCQISATPDTWRYEDEEK